MRTLSSSELVSVYGGGSRGCYTPPKGCGPRGSKGTKKSKKSKKCTKKSKKSKKGSRGRCR